MCDIIPHPLGPERKNSGMMTGMGDRVLCFFFAAVLAMSLAGCNSAEDKYVVKTPIPPAPQQAPGTGH